MHESHPEHGHTPHGHGAHAEHGITHPSGPGGSALQFSEQEWQSFRDSDKAAGRAVVLLMGSIFTIGLLLYITIDVLIW
jgi:hypothetical protein